VLTGGNPASDVVGDEPEEPDELIPRHSGIECSGPELGLAWASVRECHPMLTADGVPLS